MNTRFNIIFVLLLTFYGCKKEQIDGNTQINFVLADSLRMTPVALLVNNDSLFLTTNVWRKFIEIGKDTSGLYCSYQLTYKDILPIPPELIFKTQYVINGNQVWEDQNASFQNEEPYIFGGNISNGPKWGIGTFVDVVCEFQIANRTYRIIAKQQKIYATY